MFDAGLRSRAARRCAGVAMAAGIAVAAAGLFGQLGGAVRAATGLQSDEGDSYIAGGFATVGGGGPTFIGPVAPTGAYQPGGSTSTTASVLSCGSSCVPGVLDRLGVVTDTAAATLTTSSTTNCIPGVTTLPPGFSNGAFSGANACANTAGVGLVSAAVPNGGITADAVNVQSLTQGCTATPVAATNIVNLVIGGSAITLPDPLPPNYNVDQQVPVVGAALAALGVTVILNEQHFDDHGHGLTVNAIHVMVNGALNALTADDVIVAHAHSATSCGSTTSDTGGLTCPGGTGPCQIPVVTKDDGETTATPGSTVTYTVTIPQIAACGGITEIVDTLPPGFTETSVKGDFGTPTTGASPTSPNQEALTWLNVDGIGGSKTPIVETITVAIASSVGPGHYVNHVDLLTGACGEGHGQDRGIDVTVAAAAATPTPAPIRPPNTGGAPAAAPWASSDGAGAAVALGGGLLALAGIAGLARRRGMR